MSLIEKQPGRGPVDYVSLSILGIITFCGGMLTLFSLSNDALQGDFAPVFFGLAPSIAGLTSMGLVWLRNKTQPANVTLVSSVFLWFIGIMTIGMGGFTALNPGEQEAIVNLGFSAAFCFMPGAFLAVLGLGLYFYEYRRNQAPTPNLNARENVKTSAVTSRADKIKRSDEYLKHINKIIKDQKSSHFAVHITPLKIKLHEWETRWRELIARLDEFDTNEIIQHDIRQVPTAIAELKSEIDSEQDPIIRAQMYDTLRGFEQHQQYLDSLVRLMRRTELELDESLASIGAIYSQLQLIGARDIDDARTKRLSDDLEEQANRLDDLLSAMDDIYGETEF